MEFEPQILADWTTGQWSGAPPESSISGFCHDTREIQPGDCFVALKTAQRDGHDFLQNALEAGASAAIVSTPRTDIPLPQLVTPDPLLAFQTIAHQHRHSFPGKVVGITGSCGKTSTKDLIAHLLGDRCLKTAKNLNNTLGVPLTLTKLDPIAHDYAVIEAGINEPGEMSILGGMIAPDLIAVTMIGPAHLEKLGSLENIAREKAELVRLSSPDATMVCGENCLQYDAFHRFAGEIFSVCLACTKDPQLEYTEYRSCCQFFREADGSTRVQVFSAVVAGQFRVNASLTAGMVSNAVITVIVAILCGAKWSDVQERIQTWQPGADRGSIYKRAGNYYYVDCYNANPASMVDALETFRTLAPPEMPRLYVLGSMKELGPEADTLHRKVTAELPIRAQDRVVLIGDHAIAYAAGFPSSKQRKEQVVEVADIQAVREEIEHFDGAIFVKGSRSYALETALPDGLVARKEAAAC